jgi:hypothetical protein
MEEQVSSRLMRTTSVEFAPTCSPKAKRDKSQAEILAFGPLPLPEQRGASDQSGFCVILPWQPESCAAVAPMVDAMARIFIRPDPDFPPDAA